MAHEEFGRLADVMATLRQRCPWDAQQTHRTLVPYLIEETLEVVEAIESGDIEHLREELGDLLLQVVFHAEIASETPGGFDLEQVAAGIADKLVARHPHVFTPESRTSRHLTHSSRTLTHSSRTLTHSSRTLSLSKGSSTSSENGSSTGSANGSSSGSANGSSTGSENGAVTVEELNVTWEQRKAVEKGRTSVLEGIPDQFSAMAKATKIIARARSRSVPVKLPSDQIEATDLGRQVLDLVARAQSSGIDPEQAVRDAVRELEATVRAAEAAARTSQAPNDPR